MSRRHEDETELLRHAFRDVVPLKGRVLGKKAAAKIPQESAPRKTAAPSRASPAPPLKPQPAKHVLPELTAGAAVGVDHNTVRKLKRGKLPVTARLDLHGHTQDQAFSALSHFLTSMQGSSARAVLVITGKSGVLRREVPRWLNLSPNRARVLSFAQARISDGGDGALYVLIRKVGS